MKKIIIAFAFIFASIASVYSQVSVPSTHSFTHKVFGDSEIDEIKSYFLFTGGTTVIWCLESYDNYVYPIGFGVYSKAKSTITFSDTNTLNKKISLYNQGSLVFKVKSKNGNLSILPSNKTNADGNMSFLFGDIDGWITLTKESYILKPNNKLVGKGFRFDPQEGNGISIFFKSSTEAIIDGATHGYVCIGNTIGIITDDNIVSECFVGKFSGNELEMHRSGLINEGYPTLILTLQE